MQELIEMYRERTCLYDSKSKDYHNREMKKRCYEEMAEQVGSSGEFLGAIASVGSCGSGLRMIFHLSRCKRWNKVVFYFSR